MENEFLIRNFHKEKLHTQMAFMVNSKSDTIYTYSIQKIEAKGLSPNSCNEAGLI